MRAGLSGAGAIRTVGRWCDSDCRWSVRSSCARRCDRADAWRCEIPRRTAAWQRRRGGRALVSRSEHGVNTAKPDSGRSEASAASLGRVHAGVRIAHRVRLRLTDSATSYPYSPRQRQGTEPETAVPPCGAGSRGPAASSSRARRRTGWIVRSELRSELPVAGARPPDVCRCDPDCRLPVRCGLSGAGARSSDVRRCDADCR